MAATSCQNIGSVVDTKSEIVISEDSSLNFDSYCLKSILVSTEHRSVGGMFF